MNFENVLPDDRRNRVDTGEAPSFSWFFASLEIFFAIGNPRIFSESRDEKSLGKYLLASRSRFEENPVDGTRWNRRRRRTEDRKVNHAARSRKNVRIGARCYKGPC